MLVLNAREKYEKTGWSVLCLFCMLYDNRLSILLTENRSVIHTDHLNYHNIKVALAIFPTPHILKNKSIPTSLTLKKIFIFLGCIGICSISAFFVWTKYFQNTKIDPSLTPTPPPVLTEVEKKYADNPANITAILSDTQALLAGATSSNVTLEKSRLQLERATEVFYQKNIDSIALSLYKSGDTAIYREAFHKYGEVEIKADITPSTVKDLKSKILNNPIDPNSQDFRAYAYLLDRLNTAPKIGSG